MSAEDDEQKTATDPEPDAAGQPAPPASGLTRPVQEHLGQQLRTTYQAMAEKPAFLGDAAVPPELDRHLQRLETRERIRRQGLEAVSSALGEAGAQPPRPGRREGR